MPKKSPTTYYTSGELIISSIPSISVIGLGKLGAPLVAVMASQGFHTVGVDKSAKNVHAINSLQAPVIEPGLDQLLARTQGRLRATTDFYDAVLNTQVTFIIVPTPSDASGKFTNKYLLEAVIEVAKAIKQKPANKYHLVNITSTVVPGSCESTIKDTLEQYSGRNVGENLGLTYNPEFIALGTVVRYLLNADMILIGQSDAQAGDLLAGIYKQLCANIPPIVRLNYVLE